MRIETALDAFDTQLQADGRSAHTRRQYRRHIRALARWAAGEGRSGEVEDVLPDDLARFLSSDSARTRPDGQAKLATSMNSMRTSVRCFFSFLHRAGLVTANPARLVKRALTGTPPPRALTAKEEERLRAALAKARGTQEQRDAALFAFLLGTGLRLSCALHLDVGDVDLDEGVLAIRTKGDRRERAYIAPHVRDELREFLGDRDSGPVFGATTGRRISARHAQRRFRMWRERAALPDALSPHGLRHTFATRVYERTRDIALVQRALGHRAITSTLRYARASDEDLREALRV